MEFTSVERERRYQIVKANMETEGLDALIVFGSTGIGIPQNGNYTYISNHKLIYNTALIYFPLKGEPIMFVPGENQLLDAKRTTWIEDVRLAVPPADHVCEMLKSSSSKPEKIGISSLAAFPSGFLSKFKSEFPNIEFCEASSTISSARIVKSEEEKEIARRCSEIADAGLNCSLEILKPGMTELQWRAEVEKVMTAQGAIGGFNMIGVGKSEGEDDIFRGFVVPPTNRQFRAGDLALLEISPCLSGYYSQIVRLVSFGEPPQWIQTYHGACIAAKKKALAQLKPGNSFIQVGEAIRDGLMASGYEMKGVGSAHTIGLDLSETFMNLTNPGVVEIDQIVTMHPMVTIGDWRQLFVGETYVVNSDGPESLTKFEDQIVCIN